MTQHVFVCDNLHSQKFEKPVLVTEVSFELIFTVTARCGPPAANPANVEHIRATDEQREGSRGKGGMGKAM